MTPELHKAAKEYKVAAPGEPKRQAFLKLKHAMNRQLAAELAARRTPPAQGSRADVGAA